jgi:hypothetical protein
VSDAPLPRIPGFDAARAGKHAECDGGGEYVDHGDPPWRWYLLRNLDRRPDGYPGDAVWCLAENLFVDGED